jgi:spore maturation protein CgeB
MKQSKVVLNSSIKNKEGAHERIFAGLACGAAVVTNENAYMKEQFNEGEGLIFYKAFQQEVVNTQVDAYLSHENDRQDAVKRGQLKVMQAHTWDQRVELLMGGISSLSVFFP